MYLVTLAVVSIAIALPTLFIQGQCSPSEPSQEQDLPAPAPPNISAQRGESINSTTISLLEHGVAPLKNKETIEAEFEQLYEAAERGFRDYFEQHKEPSVCREQFYQRSCDVLRVLFRVKAEDSLARSSNRSQKLLFILSRFRSAASELRSKVFGEFYDNIEFVFTSIAEMLIYQTSNSKAMTAEVHKALDLRGREEVIDIVSKLILEFVVHSLSFSDEIPVKDPQKIALPLRQFLGKLSSRNALNVSKWVLQISLVNPYTVSHRCWKDLKGAIWNIIYECLEGELPQYLKGKLLRSALKHYFHYGRFGVSFKEYRCFREIKEGNQACSRLCPSVGVEMARLATIFTDGTLEVIAQTEQLELQGRVGRLMEGVGHRAALSADLFSSKLLYNLGDWLRKVKEKCEKEPHQEDTGKELEYFKEYQRILNNFRAACREYEDLRLENRLVKHYDYPDILCVGHCAKSARNDPALGYKDLQEPEEEPKDPENDAVPLDNQ